MWFVTFVFKSLLRQPARSSFTAVGIALAVAATVSLVGISRGFERSYLELYSKRGIDLVDVVSFEEADLYVVLVNSCPPDSPLFDQLRVISGRRLTESDSEAAMLGRV